MHVWQKVPRARVRSNNSPSTNYAQFIAHVKKKSIFTYQNCRIVNFWLKFQQPAPPATKTIVNFKPTKWGRYRLHDLGAWYKEPIMKRYHRCKCWIPDIRGNRDGDTVVFILNNFLCLSTSLDTYLKQATVDLVKIFKDKRNYSLIYCDAYS